MKRFTLIALTCLGIGFSAGCGADLKDGDTVVDEAIPAVPPTTPWTEMNLPTPEGQTIASDTTFLLVLYKGSVVDKYTGSYSDALTGGGWTKGDDYSTDGFTAIVWNKDAGQVGLAIGYEEGEDITWAYMEDLKQVEEASVSSAGSKGFTLNSARKGPRKRGAARAKSGGGKATGAKAGGGGGGGNKAGRSGGGGGGGKGKGKGKR